MVLVFVVAVLVVVVMAATAARSRDTARRRREWRANAAAVRARNERRAQEWADRFGEPPVPGSAVPGPRESPEDSGHWLVRR